MADVGICSRVCSCVLPGNKDKRSECACSKCSVYETQLKEALEELELARMIIDILQKEVLTTATTNNACGTGSVAVQEYNKQGKTKEWTLLSNKYNAIKPNKNNEYEFISLNQPIMTTNRFTLLCNLQTTKTRVEHRNRKSKSQHKV